MVSYSPLLKAFAATAAVLALFQATPVDAHGRLMKPLAEYKGPNPDSPVAAIDGNKVLPAANGKTYVTGQRDANTEAFTAAFKASNYTSLRQFLSEKITNKGPGVIPYARDVDPQCGISRIGTPQPLPDQMEFGFRPGEGFVFDHLGPCELWCDDTRVMADDNCANTYKVGFGEGPSKVPYDKAKCAGAKVMSFYWLAVHVPEFQVYIYCAAVDGGSAGPSAGTAKPSSSPSSTSTSKPTTRSPSSSSPSAPSSAPAPAPTPSSSAGPAPVPSSSSAPARVPTSAPAPAPTRKCRSDMVSASALLAAAATVALAAMAPTPVDAHGVLLKPKAQYGGKNGNSPVAKLESASVLPPLAGMSYRKTPESNTEAFTAAFQAANYTSLRQFLTAKLPSDVDPKCGISQLGEPQPLPEKVEFGFRPGEGFVENHHGPCEIWCDDTRVMADANCARNLNVELGKGPVKLAYDKAKCAGAKVLSFTWLAVHLSRWEVYVYCAAVDGSAPSVLVRL
ncbi:hypothetical protein ATCC90586_011155 [Pythium insidiosum]|nr:hypothetical protein ATCC90586_011155 [Pythium insidiosum]